MSEIKVNQNSDGTVTLTLLVLKKEANENYKTYQYAVERRMRDFCRSRYLVQVWSRWTGMHVSNILDIRQQAAVLEVTARRIDMPVMREPLQYD